MTWQRNSRRIVKRVVCARDVYDPISSSNCLQPRGVSVKLARGVRGRESDAGGWGSTMKRPFRGGCRGRLFRQISGRTSDVVKSSGTRVAVR